MQPHPLVTLSQSASELSLILTGVVLAIRNTVDASALLPLTDAVSVGTYLPLPGYVCVGLGIGRCFAIAKIPFVTGYACCFNRKGCNIAVYRYIIQQVGLRC
jgi:hypothetical protein